jgi:hypothetical protein
MSILSNLVDYEISKINVNCMVEGVHDSQKAFCVAFGIKHINFHPALNIITVIMTTHDNKPKDLAVI